MANWWKCKIVRPTTMIPYSEGTIVFAKNGDQFITLFDGQQETRISKPALKHIRLLGRMEKQDSESVQEKYDAKKAAQAACSGPTPKGKREEILF